jgi:hypothetical protein
VIFNRPTFVVCFRVEDIPRLSLKSEIVRCSACNARCWLSAATKKDMSDSKIVYTVLCFLCSQSRSVEEKGKLLPPGPATIIEIERILSMKSN